MKATWVVPDACMDRGSSSKLFSHFWLRSLRCAPVIVYLGFSDRYNTIYLPFHYSFKVFNAFSRAAFTVGDLSKFLPSVIKFLILSFKASLPSLNMPNTP